MSPTRLANFTALSQQVDLTIAVLWKTLNSESFAGELSIVDGDFATTQNLVTEKLVDYRNRSQLKDKHKLKKYTRKKAALLSLSSSAHMVCPFVRFLFDNLPPSTLVIPKLSYYR